MTQIATTIEQSRRLIKLGVPIETADMHYWLNHDNKWELRIGNGANFQVNRNRLVEAWSLSALLDLIVKHFWLCSTGPGVWHVKSLYYDDKGQRLETFITCSNAFKAVFTIIDKAPTTLLKI
jgi:hypothetical protein